MSFDIEYCYNNGNIERLKMITQEKIDRINELAHKAKTEEGLTEEEKLERALLREEYVAAFKENLRAQLENIEFVD